MLLLVAILHHPDAARKAREELDSVVGQDRLPTFEDEKSLPYVGALIKEVLRRVYDFRAVTALKSHSHIMLHRWRAIAPTGVPHATTKEDYYEGFLIPKGATVHANLRYALSPPLQVP